MPKLSVVIVSFNTKNLLKQCLDSVYGQTSQHVNITVVDNNSTDSSVPMVKQEFPKVKLIENKQNLGFAKANNIGIKNTTGQFLLLLNSDTIVTSGSFKKIIKYMDSHPDVGIASPKLINPDGSTQPNGGSLPNLTNVFSWMLFIDDLPLLNRFFPSFHRSSPHFYDTTRRTGWVAGTAMIIRRKVINQVGLLDEKIFMYAEDIDLCIRANKSGWKVVSLKKPTITHYNHGSGSKAEAIIGEFKGLKYIFSKHKPFWQKPLLSLLLKTGASLRAVVFGRILGNNDLYESYKQVSKVA